MKNLEESLEDWLRADAQYRKIAMACWHAAINHSEDYEQLCERREWRYMEIKRAWETEQ